MAIGEPPTPEMLAMELDVALRPAWAYLAVRSDAVYINDDGGGLTMPWRSCLTYFKLGIEARVTGLGA